MIAGTAAEEEAKLLPPAWVINASKYVLAAAAGHKGARIVDNYPSMLALSNINSELRRTATRLEKPGKYYDNKLRKPREEHGPVL